MKAIFLDRDGTINVDVEYPYKKEHLLFYPKVFEGLKKLQDNGFLLIVVTNQSGVGRGYFSEKEAINFNNYLQNELNKYNIKITDFFVCPHSPEENCDCRKPRTKLFNIAIKKYNINVKNSYLIGDKTIDIKSGKNIGCKTILVKTGKAGSDNEFSDKPNYIAQNLLDAANYILRD